MSLIITIIYLVATIYGLISLVIRTPYPITTIIQEENPEKFTCDTWRIIKRIENTTIYLLICIFLCLVAPVKPLLVWMESNTTECYFFYLWSLGGTMLLCNFIRLLSAFFNRIYRLLAYRPATDERNGGDINVR